MILFNGCQESHDLILKPLTREPHHRTNVLNTKQSPIQGSDKGKTIERGGKIPIILIPINASLTPHKQI
jgi:hypothetical protein